MLLLCSYSSTFFYIVIVDTANFSYQEVIRRKNKIAFFNSVRTYFVCDSVDENRKKLKEEEEAEENTVKRAKTGTVTK